MHENILIAGADGKFVWAKTMIKSKKVIVWSDEVAHLVGVRYAWVDKPGRSKSLQQQRRITGITFLAQTINTLNS